MPAIYRFKRLATGDWRLASYHRSDFHLPEQRHGLDDGVPACALIPVAGLTKRLES